MGLGAIAGLTGLSKSVDQAAATQREFATMDGLQNDMQKEKQAALMAQELEAQQYAEIAAKASEMLGPDRQKIRSKSLQLQQDIRSKIEEYGSRKAFFENGGVALLSKYKSDLLSSDETLSYMDNKKNSESLIRLQEQGKGGLIAARDMQSMMDYNNGVGDGKITYSGMKSEVKIPSELFNYQEDIPAENILMYGSNYMSIYNNWLLENPGKKGLQGKNLQDELIGYTMQNHSGMGTNQVKYQNDLAQSNLRAEREAVQKAGTGAADDTPVSYISEMNKNINVVREKFAPTLDNLMSDENYMVKAAQVNSAITAISGKITPYNEFSSNASAADSNWMPGTQFIDKSVKGLQRLTGFDKKYKLAGASIVPVKQTKEMLEFLYPGSANTNAVAVGLNGSEFYSANGQLLKQDYLDDNAESAMKYSGLVYAFIDGNDKMITKPLDHNGKPLAKIKNANGKMDYAQEELDHRKAYSGDITHEMFAVLTDQYGAKIYHKVGVQGHVREAQMTAAMGVVDNIKNQKTASAKFVDSKNKVTAQAQYDQKVLQNEVAIASSQGNVFSTPEYKADVALSKVGDGANRATLIKAYYMAYSALKNEGAITAQNMNADGAYKKGHKDNFTNAVNYAPQLKQGLINTKQISDVDYIKMFAKVTAAGNKEHEAENEVLAQTWIKIHELLNKK